MARSSPSRAATKQPTGAAHEARTASQPWSVVVDLGALAVLERLFLRAPVRLLRARNNALDQLFYDVDTIPVARRRDLLQWSDPDGSIVVVHPGDAHERDVEHFEHIDTFVAWRKRHAVDVVALAGVGSSALGTAALAANVADALQRPVAGIVSGYGVADAIAEGIVGWFVLRPGNQLRQLVDAWLRLAEPLLAAISVRTQPNGDPRRLVAYVRGLPETDALAALLRAPGARIATIVGHSKGNLCIAAALDNLPVKQWVALPPHLSVVTLGALVELPSTLRERRQFIGALDAFGWMNSILPQWPTLVPWASHTLNTRWPFHLAARDALAPKARAAPPSLEDGVRAMLDALTAPASIAAEWVRLCSGAATAFEGALAESARSLRQGAQHATDAVRAVAH